MKRYKNMKYPIEKYSYYIAEKAKQVIAVSTYAGKFIRGVAKCDPRDEFSIEKGKKLAATRCAEKVAKKRVQRARKKFAEAQRDSRARLAYEERMSRYLLDANAELFDIQTELTELEKSM
jgi:hypothetical protein